MLKDLIVNQRNLEREVLFLKNKLNVQERKDIILWLNETTNKQFAIHDNIKMGFSKWISIFSINQSHLEKVFQGNIIDGIQSVLSDKFENRRTFKEREAIEYSPECNEGEFRDFQELAKENDSSKPISPEELPIRAFSQKANVIYIYDTVKSKDSSDRTTGNGEPQDANSNESILSGEPSSNPLIKLKNKGNMTAWSWRILKNEDLEKIIESIRRKLLLDFTKWQTENRELIESSDEMKENEIEYMLKFNCIKITLEKRIEIIKKWLYDTIKENKVLTSIEFQGIEGDGVVVKS
jgi:hypothetical protein